MKDRYFIDYDESLTNDIDLYLYRPLNINPVCVLRSKDDENPYRKIVGEYDGLDIKTCFWTRRDFLTLIDDEDSMITEVSKEEFDLEVYKKIKKDMMETLCR